MKLIAGRATVVDVDDFLARLHAIGEEHGATVQAFDARYIVDRDHLERAVALAGRARDRGAAIADDPAMEILCYAAGTRQIEVALELGVGLGTPPVVIVIDGGDDAAAAASISSIIEPDPAVLCEYDRTLVQAFFDVNDDELAATDAGIPALVRERVALLVVER